MPPFGDPLTEFTWAQVRVARMCWGAVSMSCVQQLAQRLGPPGDLRRVQLLLQERTPDKQVGREALHRQAQTLVRMLGCFPEYSD